MMAPDRAALNPSVWENRIDPDISSQIPEIPDMDDVTASGRIPTTSIGGCTPERQSGMDSCALHAQALDLIHLVLYC